MANTNKKRKRTSQLTNEERGGGKKRKHIIMDKFRTLVQKRFSEGETNVKDLQDQITKLEPVIERFDGQIALSALASAGGTDRYWRRCSFPKTASHMIV